ncbi:RHS repeat-associated core domain-containing protein [Myxococcus sp. XM-1-1-1]|uniref:RHS repeat-associated core domain-containing protein n=1 Tax=Myxococcus sp. XM-1-1-1 TaxID=2874602 RepID=UPI001CBB00A2|nr:RHS repeat-associated core domain-containing protein [Myxococcus sp. XM-1-1-1]
MHRAVMAVVVGGLLSAVGAWAVDDGGAMTDEELSTKIDELTVNPQPPLAGPGEYGASEESPVTLGALKPSYSHVDLSIKGALGPLSLMRMAGPPQGAWESSGVISPFGRIAGPTTTSPQKTRLRWTHNFHSYIELREDLGFPCPVDETCGGFYWDVHGGPAGTKVTFDFCEVDGCFGANGSVQDLRLQSLDGALIVHSRDGRYVYLNPDPNNPASNIWRLQFIEPLQYDEAACPLEYFEDAGSDVAASCHRRIARLSYALPSDCRQGSSQDIAQTGGADVELLSSVSAANGARMVFRYQRLLSRVPSLIGKTHECVLRAVDLVGRDGSIEPSAVTYQYEQRSLQGGPQPVAGLLVSTEWPDQSGGPVTASKLEYGYWASDAGVWSIRKDGVQVVHQVLGARGDVLDDSDGQGNSVTKNRYLITAEANGCQPGVFSATGSCLSQDQYFTTHGRSVGDGSGYFVNQVMSRFRMSLAGQDPLGDQGVVMSSQLTTVQCDVPCLGLESPPAQASWRVKELPVTVTRTVEAAGSALHPNGSRTVYHQALAPSLMGKAFLPPAELRKVSLGATDLDGGSALQEKEYTYLYGGAGRPAARQAFEQLVASDTSASAFRDEDPSLNVVVQRQYDPVTNRLLGVVRSGYTMTFAPASNSWSRVARSVGTYYLTQDVCSSQPLSDAQGRIRTVMGPCEVASGSATACVAGAAVPITTYEYWDASAADDRAGHMKAKKVYPAGCGSTPIVTHYDDYDARGRLLQMTDANGIVTRFEFEGMKLVRKTAAAGDPQLEAATEYGYDDNATHGDYLRYADGRYEVLCYRKNTLPGQGCTGGQLTTLLQWKATSSLSSGATHAERVDYTYHLGKLRSETFRDETNQVRRTRFYDRDPLERQTFEAWGAAGPALASDLRYTQTSLFDAQGNRVGLGQPYQPAAVDPEPWCGGFDPNSLGEGVPRQPASPHCKAFAYDRLNRLVGLLEPVDGTSSTGDAVQMCLSYDKAGNLQGVRQGCPKGSGAAGDCSQCNQPLLGFRHDDFGNVVRIDAPWGSGPAETTGGPQGRGRFHYQYDAAGNPTRKQTPSMGAATQPQWVENQYDQMKRILKSEAVESSGGVQSRKTLFEYYYDQTVTPPWGCPGYAPTRPSKAMGRAQVLTDSLGDSWYRYDSHGNVVHVARNRPRAGIPARTDLCYESGNRDAPNAGRYYDNTGRLLSEAYPGGRVLAYNYHSLQSGRPHQIESVDAVLFNGVAWDQLLRVVEEVRWEPFGGLRSYVLVAPKAPAGAQKARVEYHLNGANQPLSTCNGTAFSAGGDTTGRLSGLTVSRLEAGGAQGDIFKRGYTWKADQLLREDTCVLETGNVPPNSIRYAEASSGAPGYDARLQLKHAHQVANSSSTAGGSFGSRAYQYDARGNRLLDVQEGWRFKGEYAAGGSRVDQLTSRYLEGVDCGGSICPPRLGVTQRYTYDPDGRVSRIATYKNRTDAVASPFHAVSLDATTDGPHAAIGAVYRQVSDSEDRVYEYFYDAVGRRRLKRYCVSTSAGVLEDEYFHDGTRLLEDWGNTTFNPSTAVPVHDEYIWLGGKPIAFFKVRFDQDKRRTQDFAGECPRYGQPAPCGLYFLVTDALGKPVLALDSYRRVTGVADYDPYGQVNRTTLVADSPVLSTGQDVLMATAQVPNSSALVTHMRARFPVLDVQGGSGVYLADTSGSLLNGVDGSSTLMTNVRAAEAVSRWVVPSSTGGAQVRFQSASTSGAIQDAALGSVEYRRFQVGATPVWTPLRFSGQYHDEETGFFENWNRFYEPRSGRYLGPEPKAQDSTWLLARASEGRGLYVYSYANNNALFYADPEGLWAFSVGVTGGGWILGGGDLTLELTIDDDFNLALQGAVGARLGYGAGLSASPFLSLNSGADTVSDLEGFGVNANVDVLILNLGLGGSLAQPETVVGSAPPGTPPPTLMPGSPVNNTIGPQMTIGGWPGVGLSAGVSAEVSYTWTLWKTNLAK